MSDLIEALQIFLKYGDPSYPTHCEHDELTVHGYDRKQFTASDVQRLDELGFFWSEYSGSFMSYKFGSC